MREIIQGEGFYISYNDFQDMGSMSILDDVLWDANQDETAVCMEDGSGEFYILNGDFRDEYRVVMDDLDKVKAVYFSHEDKVSDWGS